MQIRVGDVGKIEAGRESGHYVQVVDDSSNTGGFLILTAISPDMRNGFDDWVESQEALERYFEESGWTINWSTTPA